MVEGSDIAELKALLISLQAEVEQLRAENTALKATIADLQAKLAQNSTNSSKPPASDGLAKKPGIKPALTKDTVFKKGGQAGHQGKTLLLVDTPDTIIEHRPTYCRECGNDLAQAPAQLLQRRQVFDLPPPRLHVEEHRQLALTCRCGCLNVSPFPALVAAPVQYGPRLHAQSVLLNIDYKLPFAKIRQLWTDVVGYAYNAATLSTAQAHLSEQLLPIEAHIKAQIQQAQVAHFDETGMRVTGKLYWLHVACTALWTYLFVHPNRGQKALKAEESVFLGCTRWLVHDCWSSYFAAGVGRHALCGAHLLRELQGQVERGRAWALALHTYLLALYKASRQGGLAANERRVWEAYYRQLCEQGLAQEPPGLVFFNPVGGVLNKRPKQTSGRNLLDRLVAHEAAVLAFAFEPGVPFSNNEAERALRPAKIKQKVSGGFRTEAGAATYARLSGFIATLRKQHQPVVEQLAHVMKGTFQWST